MADPVTPLEMGRLFLGDQDLMFYVEILVRTGVIYIYTFGLLRLFGRRTKSQLSILDVIVIVALGSAVGDATFYPEVPLLHALLVITLIVGFNKGVISLTQQSRRLREWVEGKPVTVVKNGVVQIDNLHHTSIGLRALMELLRLRGVSNLGQIDCVILEPSSQISVYTRDAPLAGLSIIPDDEDRIDAVIANQPDDGDCCNFCGFGREDDGQPCPNGSCGQKKVRRRTQPRYSL